MAQFGGASGVSRFGFQIGGLIEIPDSKGNTTNQTTTEAISKV